MDLTVERLRHLLMYDPHTGIFIRNISVNRAAKELFGEYARYESK